MSLHVCSLAPPKQLTHVTAATSSSRINTGLPDRQVYPGSARAWPKRLLLSQYRFSRLMVIVHVSSSYTLCSSVPRSVWAVDDIFRKLSRRGRCHSWPRSCCRTGGCVVQVAGLSRERGHLAIRLRVADVFRSTTLKC